MSNKAFRVTYRCGNCGKEWSEEYEKEWLVTQEWGGVSYHGPNCLMNRGSNCGTIVCSCCERYQNVRIIKRAPILDFDSYNPDGYYAAGDFIRCAGCGGVTKTPAKYCCHCGKRLNPKPLEE